MAEHRPSDDVYDAGSLPPDARAVDALARLQLDARRRGERACVRGASSELQELLAFCGLSFVLGVEPSPAAHEPRLGLQPGREPEEREDRRGVEEERHLGDLPA
jgi:hypothetical protein